MSGERQPAPQRRQIENPDTAFADRKTAPKEGTPVALMYLESYLDGKKNRRKATMSLLGCSDRTAKRIISRSTPYRAAMKMEWVFSICCAVGKPMDDVLGTRAPRSWQQCLMGWNHSRTTREALQMAADCALSIVYKAMGLRNLKGSFLVLYESGMPREVAVFLSAHPAHRHLGGKYGMHQIVVTRETDGSTGRKRMYCQHLSPTDGQVSKKFLTPSYVEEIIHRIYALTKDHAPVER